jgi:hypothetical protein
MDQRSTIGTSPRLARPIHRACVVPGCWCGSTTADSRTAGRTVEIGSTRRPIRSIDAAVSANLTNIAWRCVGLPVV